MSVEKKKYDYWVSTALIYLLLFLTDHGIKFAEYLFVTYTVVVIFLLLLMSVLIKLYIWIGTDDDFMRFNTSIEERDSLLKGIKLIRKTTSRKKSRLIMYVSAFNTIVYSYVLMANDYDVLALMLIPSLLIYKLQSFNFNKVYERSDIE